MIVLTPFKGVKGDERERRILNQRAPKTFF